MLKLIQTVKRKSKGTEAGEQAVFFRWLAIAYPDVRKLSFAIPNGGFRRPAEAIALKKQGVTAGVPDIFIAIPTTFWAGLFIEFKVGNNKVSGLQQAFIFRLREAGYKVDVCYSFDDAKDVVLAYLKDSDYA